MVDNRQTASVNPSTQGGHDRRPSARPVRFMFSAQYAVTCRPDFMVIALMIRKYKS
jgi:hypothetical protein